MRKKTVYIVILLCFIALAVTDVHAQSDTSVAAKRKLRIKNPEGTEFWLCFEKNYRDTKQPSDSLMLELFITGDESSNVSIDIDGIGYKNKFYVPAGTVKNIKIPPEAEVKSEEIVERLAVHIVSDKPISVYGLNRRRQTTDTYLGFSTEVLGTEYRAMCYTVSDGLMPQLAIVATEDNTEVTITPTVATSKHFGGKPYQVRLRKGDVYQVVARDQISSKTDLTGTLVTANKKIAVFSGHQCAYVPPKEIACNHLVEQMPPINSWGKHFYIGRLQPRAYYTYRVLANESETRVFEDNRLVKTLNAGEYYEATVRRNIQITTSKPVLVAQYSHGFKSGDNIGDPMMILISPTQQFLQQYRFATPVNGQWQHYVNLVVPTKAIGTMKLDGQPLIPDSAHFEQLGLSRYSMGYVRIPFGSHIVEGSMPFGLYSYGFGYGDDSFDAYGTMGGQSFMEYEPANDTLAPMLEDIATESYVNLIFRDDRVDDSGIKGVDVVNAIGLTLSQPKKVEEGLPQLSVLVKPEKAGIEGRMVIEVMDVAMNKATFTVCYTMDTKTGKFVFITTEGITESCFPDPGVLIGAFGKFSVLFHTADFSSSGNISAQGKFKEASGFGGYAGIIAARFLKPWLAVSIRLSFENYGGTLEAPDSTISHIFDPSTNSLVNRQESRSLKLTGLFTNLSFAAEYYFEKYFYALGGLNLIIPLSDAVDYRRSLLMPESFTYADGSRQIKENVDGMGSLSSLGFGIFGGIGFSYQITYQVSAFAEGVLNHRFNSMINDAGWYLNNMTIQGGIRVRF